MKQFDAEILENRELAPDCFELSFLWPEGLRAPLPGQFVTVGHGSPVPFLRSLFPLASFRRESRAASVFYRPQDGASLTGKQAGGTVDLLGPRGFAFQPVPGRQPLLVGGGSQLGALVFGANSLAAKGFRPRLLLVSDQGSAPGFRLAPEVERSHCHGTGLKAALDEEGAGRFVWAVGGTETLRSVHFWCQNAGLPCQVLLESPTACAVGACQGCAVATTGGFARVCTEGPVFSSEVLQWT